MTARGTGRDRDLSEQEFEHLLERALRVDLPAAESAPSRPRRRILRWAAVAAGILVALGVSVRMLQESGYISTGDLGRDVVAHIHHEPQAVSIPVVADQAAVSREEVAAVIRKAGAELGPIQPMVRYAKLCPFRGAVVAHLVVQGSEGPVTVLLLPDEEVDGPVPVEEDDFVGTILPLPIGGSIAVVGERGEGELNEIQREVAGAVRWRL